MSFQDFCETFGLVVAFSFAFGCFVLPHLLEGRDPPEMDEIE